MKQLVILGAGGHGAVAAEVAELLNYTKILFLDDRAACGRLGHPLVGKTADYREYLSEWEFFVAIGNSCVREDLQTELERNGARIATLIHPSAVISRHAVIGSGCIAAVGAVVNPGARVGKGVILNTYSSVDHDSIVGGFCHIAVGAHLCGTVKIGERTWIGAGAVVSNDIAVCGDCMIGAGSVVVEHIEEPGTYYGVPARRKRDVL